MKLSKESLVGVGCLPRIEHEFPAVLLGFWFAFLWTSLCVFLALRSQWKHLVVGIYNPMFVVSIRASKLLGGRLSQQQHPMVAICCNT